MYLSGPEEFVVAAEKVRAGRLRIPVASAIRAVEEHVFGRTEVS
jgi:hypothetical protein